MCDPISASLALAAAGTASQVAGQRKAQKAMDGAREAERIRQKGYQEQSDAALGKSMAGAEKGAQDAIEGKALAERKAASDAAVAEVRQPVEATGANLAGDQAANAVIESEKAAQAAKSLGFASQQGGAKAKLLSVNDLNFANSIANARALQEQARIANLAKGSADVLPIELEAASRKGQGLQTLGTLLSTAGTVVGMGAGAGWWDKPTTADILAKGNAATNFANPATVNTAANNIAAYNKTLLPLDPFKLPAVQPQPFLGSGNFPAMYKFPIR